ncbi:MAG: GGDEF domain-containing protein [Myxococcota bacterium]
MIQRALTADTATQLALFQGVDFGEISDVVRSCPIIELESETVLIEPGPCEGRMYIVLQGILRVHVGSLNAEPVASLGIGECVGELSIIDQRARSAFVVAGDTCRLLELSDAHFWHLVESSSAVARNILKLLARRLRGGNQAVTLSRQLQQEYRQSAVVDALTGLHNRRWLDEMLPRQLKRSRHDGDALSVLMIDVDHFKAFNDTHGHQSGDFVLHTVSQVLQSSVRPTDRVARYGGEEFTILLPGTTIEGALRGGDRVRGCVAATVLQLPDGTQLPPVTISIGAAESQADETPSSLLARADEALYAAKNEGRNRVCAAP